MRRLTPPAALLGAALAAALLLAGCGTSLSPAEMKDSCTDLASVVRTAGLAGSPTQAQAKSAADALDSRLPKLRDPSLHDAAVALHTHLHGVDTALGKGDAAKAAELAAKAREDVAKAASVCALPASDFLGG